MVPGNKKIKQSPKIKLEFYNPKQYTLSIIIKISKAGKYITDAFKMSNALLLVLLNANGTAEPANMREMINTPIA